MKIFTTIDVTYKEGKRGEAVEALVELADVSKKNWPNAHFHVLSPRTGQHGRLALLTSRDSAAGPGTFAAQGSIDFAALAILPI